MQLLTWNRVSGDDSGSKDCEQDTAGHPNFNAPTQGWAQYLLWPRCPHSIITNLYYLDYEGNSFMDLEGAVDDADDVTDRRNFDAPAQGWAPYFPPMLLLIYTI